MAALPDVLPAMQSIPPAVLGMAIEGARGSFTVRCMHFAAYSLAIYDWILCLPEEMPLITAPRLSPAKIAYVICRYWPLVFQPFALWIQGANHSVEFCQRMFRVPLALFVFNFATAASVLSVRLYAFTGCSRWVAGGMMASLLTVMIYQLSVVGTRIALVPSHTGCYPVEVNPSDRFLSGYFFAPLLFDCMATLVFVLHGLKTYSLSANGPSFSPKTARFTHHFMREGFLYFLAIGAVNFTSTALTFQRSVLPFSGVIAPWSVLLPNVLACRLVLNMRAMARSEFSQANFSVSGSSGSKPHTIELSMARNSYRYSKNPSANNQATPVSRSPHHIITEGTFSPYKKRISLSRPPHQAVLDIRRSSSRRSSSRHKTSGSSSSKAPSPEPLPSHSEYDEEYADFDVKSTKSGLTIMQEVVVEVYDEESGLWRMRESLMAQGVPRTPYEMEWSGTLPPRSPDEPHPAMPIPIPRTPYSAGVLTVAPNSAALTTAAGPSPMLVPYPYPATPALHQPQTAPSTPGSHSLVLPHPGTPGSIMPMTANSVAGQHGHVSQTPSVGSGLDWGGVLTPTLDDYTT